MKNLNKKLRLISSILIFLLMGMNVSLADNIQYYSFSEIWKKVSGKNPSTIAADQEYKASEIHAKRASRHWWPNIYLTGRVYSSDDPLSAFASKLSQREISNQDFNPSQLNHPSKETTTQLGLGLDLPIYEGGGKKYQAQAAQAQAMSSKYQFKNIRLNEYSATVNSYASLVILHDQNVQIEQVNVDAEKLLTNYRIGAKSNPVGYSGLLALKGIVNRNAEILLKTATSIKASRNQINLLCVECSASWEPQQINLLSFIDSQYPGIKSESAPVAKSAAIKGAEYNALAVAAAKESETAKLMPRVGLFAENSLNSGSRGEGNSVTAGAYLQWQLFSGDHLGTIRESELSSYAAKSNLKHIELQQQQAWASSQTQYQSLLKSLSLTEKNIELINEQLKVSISLFKNGAINALQLTDVISRKVDLILHKSEIQFDLLNVSSQIFLMSGVEETPL